MFAARRSVRAALLTPADAGFRHLQRRGVASREFLQTPNHVAKQLADTGLWHYARWAKDEKGKKIKKPKADKARVNVTSNELCGDILDYIRPTLDRHKGCDLLDLFPGPGIWSRKLHDAVQPRSHLLLEPDHELYGPMLEDLVERPGVQLLPNNGYMWPELNAVLTPKYLPHQVDQSSEPEPKPNDTLLVTANFSFYPKKKYGTFDNITQLLLFQFVNSIRQRSLIYKYGHVRLLVWIGDEEKGSVLPRLLQRRKRLAVDAELSTEYLAEIAGANGLFSQSEDPDVNSGVYARDHIMDLESSKMARERMERLGLKIPPGREPSITRAFDALSDEEKKNLHAGNQPAVFKRSYIKAYSELEALVKEGKVTLKKNKQLYARYKSLSYKNNWENTRAQQIFELTRERESLPTHLSQVPDNEREAMARRIAAWEEKISRMDRQLRNEFLLLRDNLHIFRQDPPVLSWDRRPYEPLAVSPLEFFPNIPCALLDIQPKTMHPLFREWGPDTTRAGETFGVLLPTLFRASVDPLDKVLEGVYPGAAEGILPHCPSLVNRKVGGTGYSGAGGLNLRTLNERQIIEILDAWMKWPFRPGFSELVGRGAAEEDDYLSGGDAADDSFTKSQTTDSFA